MKRGNDEIQNELRVQLRLLRKAAHDFDVGDWDESRNISRALRVLCTPDNRGKPSLIEMAGMGNRNFQDTRFPCHPMSIAPYLPLIVVVIGPLTIGPRAFLGSGLKPNSTSFADWMEQVAADDRDSTAYSRRKMIKDVANLGGGTHYPADVRAFFKKLQEITYEARRGPEIVGATLKGVELHSLRQIAHEVLVSLDHDYDRKVQVENGSLIFGGIEAIPYPGRRLHLRYPARTVTETGVREGYPHGFTGIFGPKVKLPYEGTGVSSPCPCKSGLSFKECCSEARNFNEQFIRAFEERHGLTE